MDNTIDYGQWNVPTDWSQITLLQFQELERYYSDKDKQFDVRDVLHIFTNKTVDEINELPIEFVEILMNKLNFLQEKPKEQEPSPKIEIDGETYIINVIEKLKTAEWIAIDASLKADKYDYASFLAIICRKEGEVYDSKFEAEMFEKRREMFEKQPITKVMPTVTFFLNLWLMSETPSLLSSQVTEAINLTRKNIETSKQNGELSALYTRWLMRKLRKLEKLVKRI